VSIGFKVSTNRVDGHVATKLHMILKGCTNFAFQRNYTVEYLLSESKITAYTLDCDNIR